MEKPKLTSGTINLYALSNGTLTMAFTVVTQYLMIFCTDYLGISAAAYGTAMGIAKTFDFFVCLVAGPIIEKSNMKWGKYLSWTRILTATLFFGNIIQMLDTSAFTDNATVKLVIVCIGYMMFHGSMNFNATVRGTLVAKLAGANMEDRRKLTTRQSQVGAAVTIISSMITLPAINLVTKITGSETLGYTLVVVIFSCVFLVCNVLFIKAATPFDPPTDKNAAKKTATVKEIVESIVSNKQMLVLVLVYTIHGIGGQFYAGTTAYFFRATGNFQFMTVALTTRSIVAFVASLFVPSIGKKLGKKNALVVSRYAYAVGALIIYFFAYRNGEANVWIMTFGMCFIQAGTYLFMSFGVNYWLDCGEYGYYTTGKDMRGIASAVMNIPTKIGMAVGGTLVGYLVAWSGYTIPAGQTVGYFEHMDRFMMTLALFPAITAIVSGVLTQILYKLTDEQAAMYAKANAEREAANK